MILSSAPTNEATLSNVGAVSAFTIKATAKSFSILSSGLYANKIRAIIRELSCNALDSHRAAGNPVPFIVHLPTSLEPYFAVRDFGTGLSHAQVIDIFTSFFTSTKTESNDFVGALGLGSKSPFSYTDNFTVTTVQAGRRGIYTAFIDGSGVPSIALMMAEDTDQPNGVEVRFAVADRFDFRKFTDEAKEVFRFWQGRPTITGVIDFEFVEPEYLDKDIIPGVHTLANTHSHSYAVMGNIAYPIQVPAADTTLAEYRSMLGCGLLMEFAIGELDFQASREGLSYVPLTLDSIRAKLEATSSQLAVRIATEADAIENLWERAAYLHKRSQESLWTAAVYKYVADTKFSLLTAGNRWDAIKRFDLPTERLASEFNIVIRAFGRQRHSNSCSAYKAENVRSTTIGSTTYEEMWRVPAEMDRFFVFNDTKVGALERAKFHWRKRKLGTYSEVVYVLEPFDRAQPMKRVEFLAEIMNPPAANVMDASSLELKERAAGLGKNVSILRLESQSRGYRYSDNVVWKDAGKADQYDAATTYYYLPLSGYKSLGKVAEIKWLKDILDKSGVYGGTIYGVRKSDTEWVEAQSNWVNLDTMIEAKLSAMSDDVVMGIVSEAIRFKELFHWEVAGKIAADSPYALLSAAFKDVKGIDSLRRSALKTLCQQYKVVTATVDPQAMIDRYEVQMEAVKSRYPLLSHVGRYTDSDLVAGYINLVDSVQVVQNS